HRRVVRAREREAAEEQTRRRRHERRGEVVAEKEGREEGGDATDQQAREPEDETEEAARAEEEALSCEGGAGAGGARVAMDGSEYHEKEAMVARAPAVAGLFYPASPSALTDVVDRMLASVRVDAAAPVPKALVVPHAGYVYSGPVAASAYARLRPAADRITR